MLLLALDDLPYGYYQLLRWVTCGVALHSAFAYMNADSITWARIFFGMALLFNPVLPFYLSKDIWAGLDLAAAVLMAFSLRVKVPNV
jgi:hypothetical protein